MHPRPGSSSKRHAPALEGVGAGDALVVITWLDRADRDTLQVHPRDDRSRPLTGVFARSI